MRDMQTNTRLVHSVLQVFYVLPRHVCLSSWLQNGGMPWCFWFVFISSDDIDMKDIKPNCCSRCVIELVLDTQSV